MNIFYCVKQFSKAFKGNWLLINIYNNPTSGLELNVAIFIFFPVMTDVLKSQKVPTGPN